MNKRKTWFYCPFITLKFINADLPLYQSFLLGYNLFTYCVNNPVNMFDLLGESVTVATLILVGSIVAGLEVSGYTAYTSHKYTGKVDWTNTIFSGLSTFVFCYTYGMSAYGMYLSYCDYQGHTLVTSIG